MVFPHSKVFFLDDGIRYELRTLNTTKNVVPWQNWKETKKNFS